MASGCPLRLALKKGVMPCESATFTMLRSASHSSRTHAACPPAAATAKGDRPRPSLVAAAARFASRRAWTHSVWPLAAARARPVEPSWLVWPQSTRRDK